MKTAFLSLSLAALALGGVAHGQAADFFTNFVRQVQLPTGVTWDMSVSSTGEELSPLAIDPGGARFELWTIQNDPVTVYLLDTRYVGTYVPMAEVLIRTEDPNTYTGIPRTRADRPFVVDIEVSGLLAGETDPEASKSVNLLRHVQSYGAGGTGVGLDRTQAALLSQVSLNHNALHRMTIQVNSVPGANRAKVRGEERFSVYSLDDYQAPPSQLASMFVQIWPVADGTLSGIENGDQLRFNCPTLTIDVHDLYPDSRTYVQIYQGSPSLGTEGVVVAGSGLVIYDAVPHDRTLVIDDWDSVITDSGNYTMELVTVTPFGIDRLDYVNFNVDRDIEINGTVTTVE
ncbi:hypothetical protein [Haloferula sargassicola]|uniref:Uncharacterized protein n=1 Tax=Haloferula sargassicola TaxID=490096 RepID=A0ABP9UUX0_9BACT